MSKPTTATILARADAEYGSQATAAPEIWRKAVELVARAGGADDARRLSHESVPEAILLCEALNWAAKQDGFGYSVTAYDLKGPLCWYATRLMDETGEGAWGHHTDEHEWEVLYLHHTDVGVAGFHGLDTWSLPEWPHAWSGVSRQPRAFDMIRSWFGDRRLVSRMSKLTAPGATPRAERLAAGRLHRRLRKWPWLPAAEAAREAAAEAAYAAASGPAADTAAGAAAIVAEAWARIESFDALFPEARTVDPYFWFECQLDQYAVDAARAAALVGQPIPRRDFAEWVSNRYRPEYLGSTPEAVSAPSPEYRVRLPLSGGKSRRFEGIDMTPPSGEWAADVGSLSRFRGLEPADTPTAPSPEPPPRSRRFHGVEFAD